MKFAMKFVASILLLALCAVEAKQHVRSGENQRSHSSVGRAKETKSNKEVRSKEVREKHTDGRTHPPTFISSGQTYDMDSECDPVGWEDADGYNCTWYDEAEGACTQDYAHEMGDNGMAAVQACCACDGVFHAEDYPEHSYPPSSGHSYSGNTGHARNSHSTYPPSDNHPEHTYPPSDNHPEHTYPPSSGHSYSGNTGHARNSTYPPSSGQTYDMDSECDPVGWEDADGYNCTWYDEAEGACTEDYAHEMGDNGMAAVQACCACDGVFHAEDHPEHSYPPSDNHPEHTYPPSSAPSIGHSYSGNTGHARNLVHSGSQNVEHHEDKRARINAGA